MHKLPHLYQKQGAFDDFVAKAGARAMDDYSLDDAVDYKNRLPE
jgi:hypothetical protein